MRRLLAFAGAAGLVGAALSVTGLGAASASASSNTVYVSPHASYKAHDRSCGSARYSSIQSAVHAAPLHGNVVVCPGIYKTSVTIDRATWTVPAVFRCIAERGHVAAEEMERTFNLGVGMIALVPAADADRALATLLGRHVPAWIAGTVAGGASGPGVVDLVGKHPD